MVTTQISERKKSTKLLLPRRTNEYIWWLKSKKGHYTIKWNILKAKPRPQFSPQEGVAIQIFYFFFTNFFLQTQRTHDLILITMHISGFGVCKLNVPCVQRTDLSRKSQFC